MTRRTESEVEWLDNLRTEVEDIVDSIETRPDEQLGGMWEIDSLEVRNLDNNQLNQEEISAMSKVEKPRQWYGSGAVTKWKEEFPSLKIIAKMENIYFNLPIKGLRNQVASIDLICWQRVLNAARFSCFQSIGSFQPLIEAYN